MAVDPEDSARKLLELVPVIMQDIRSEMRSRRSSELTVPQFRVLAFVNRNEGPSLWEVAHHMGLTPSTTSRLVDGLIARGLMARIDNPADRRRLQLTVTDRGATILKASSQGTVEYLADMLSRVDADNREIVDKAMEVLRTIFAAT
ncbi:MAG: MarR family winged helix-turn-helix transcriptional regulator [Halobacteriota archaeon]